MFWISILIGFRAPPTRNWSNKRKLERLVELNAFEFWTIATYPGINWIVESLAVGDRIFYKYILRLAGPYISR